MWWPMQDYFNLNLARIDNAVNLNDPKYLRGMWDIWWNRDYKAYAEATGNPSAFDLDKWPVSDHMVYYVRKDIAAQLWDLGTGNAKVTGLPADLFSNLRCDICAASVIFNTTAAPLNFPRGVAVGPDGNVYVADSQNARIAIFSPTGQFIRQFGTLSPKSDQPGFIPNPGTFREPWSVAVDKEGVIYVADTWNHRIQIFSNDGTPLRSWGQLEQAQPGSTGSPTGLYGPRALTLDDQSHIYVADTGNKRIRVYDALGKLIRDIGSAGSGDGQLNEPVGVVVNSKTNELFVADSWNHRIVVFDVRTGAYLRKWDSLAWAAMTPNTDNGNRPFLTLDRTGTYVFVSDPDTGRVLVYNTAGTPVLSFGRLASSPAAATANQFGVLGGMAVDPATGRFFLVDAGAGRVLRFEPNAFPGLTAQTNNETGGNQNQQSTQNATAAATVPIF